MQSQDAATDYFFKLWPWLEANAKRLIVGAVVVIIAIFIISFYLWRQNQEEITAGQALTQADMSGNSSQTASACLKIATDYPGTPAGQRARLQGAATLFAEGKYPEAQAQFQKFLDAYPGNSFASQALLGIAACLDAQGKTAPAIVAYQNAINQTSEASVIAAAKFALARIDEQQGKIADAENLYENIAQSFPNSSMASEAGLRAMELRAKLPSTSAPVSTMPAAAGTFNLIH